MGSADFVVQIFVHIRPDSVLKFLDCDVFSLTLEEFELHFIKMVAIVLFNAMNSSPICLF